VIELGRDVVAEQAKARYEDGMLRVEVPLAPVPARPRVVPIKTQEP
jgi:HSP20 family molecular chaperone IbpA